LAQALALPFTCLARGGARSGDVLTEQLPRLRGPYELGCIYIGVNDVRTPGFDLDVYAANLELIAQAVAAQCARLLIVALPPTLGRPPAPAAPIAAANERVARVASAHGAPLLGLESLTGSELVQPDAVHLTARGEAHMALLACELLAPAAVDDTELRRALAPLTPRARARYLLVQRAPALAWDLRRRTLEGLKRRSGRCA
jgi:hypothetical protein